MSKSRYNVVPPDDLIARYGADTERVYTLFIAPPEKEAAWSDEGVIGAYRFLTRVWNVAGQVASGSCGDGSNDEATRALVRKTHQTIAAVSQRMERFEFNTAISSLMELSNAIGEVVSGGSGDPASIRRSYGALLQMLHPFAPHVTEELWEAMGEKGFVLLSSWPVADASLMQEDVLTIVVQVNGKLRGQVEVPNPPVKEVVLDAVRRNERVQQWLVGKEVVKEVYVPGKLVNIVVKG